MPNREQNFKKLDSNYTQKTILGVIVLLASLPVLYTSLQNFARSQLLDSMYKTSSSLKLPEVFANNKKTLQGPGNLQVETFIFKGNPNSQKMIILVPGMTGVYYNLDSIVTDSDILAHYNTIYTFNQPSQGQTTGPVTNGRLLDTVNTVIDYASKQLIQADLTVLCISAGAISCTNSDMTRFDKPSKIILLNPVVGSKELLENIQNGKITNNPNTQWIKTNGKDNLSYALEHAKYIKYIFPKKEDFEILKHFQGPKNYKTQNQKFTVIYSANDEFFTSNQYIEVFGNNKNIELIQSLTKSHSDVAKEDFKKILF
jgi:hypothetical protein